MRNSFGVPPDLDHLVSPLEVFPVESVDAVYAQTLDGFGLGCEHLSWLFDSITKKCCSGELPDFFEECLLLLFSELFLRVNSQLVALLHSCMHPEDSLYLVDIVLIFHHDHDSVNKTVFPRDEEQPPPLIEAG